MSFLALALAASSTITPDASATATAAAAPILEERPLLSFDPLLEHRTRYQRMMPLSLNDDTATRPSWFDQRLRAGLTLGIGEKVKLTVLADVLPDVVFGDNGSFVGVPQKNKGGVVATRAPNLARIRVDRLDPSASGLDRDNYGFVLDEAEPLALRLVYGDVLLPFGLVRAGRMPLANFGRSVLVHDGRRNNRWGVSKTVDSADGAVFGTNLGAIIESLMGDKPTIDPERGLFWAILVGQSVEQQVQTDDDLMQYVGTLWYQTKERPVLGFDVEHLRVGVIWAHRVGDQYETMLDTVSGYFELETKWLRFVYHHLQMIGGTREISEGLALLGTSSGPPARQDISAFGGFGEIAAKLGPLGLPIELSFELYYASGDEDPRSSTPINQLTFAEDTNVGLHLFENVMAYQSARSAALAVANLRGVSPPTYPVAEIDTRGGLQNAFVLFPQLVAWPLDWLSARAGVMFAYSLVPVVDPIGTVLNTDGVEVEDDRINYVGGKPGTHYGTEIDLGVTLTPVDHFAFDLEGAYLIPGDALLDEHGDAVSSFFFTARATIFLD